MTQHETLVLLHGYNHLCCSMTVTSERVGYIYVQLQIVRAGHSLTKMKVWSPWMFLQLQTFNKYQTHDDTWYCLYLLVCIFSSIQVFKFLKAYSSTVYKLSILLLCKCNAVDRFHNICIIMECYNLEWY